MKLWNPALAGTKLGVKGGIIEVGADGCIEVSDESLAGVLLKSGFRSEKPENKSKAQPRQHQTVVEAPKKAEPKVEIKAEPVEVRKASASVVDPSPEDFDDDDELEIEDIGEYSAKDAMLLVKDESDVDILEAWKTCESENKRRKSVLKTIEERMSEVR